MTNFLSWIPSGFVKVMCILKPCPETLLLWTTTVLSTVNPVVHPLATAAKSLAKRQRSSQFLLKVSGSFRT